MTASKATTDTMLAKLRQHWIKRFCAGVIQSSPYTYKLEWPDLDFDVRLLVRSLPNP